ncbi:MAG: glucose-6-phosphate isomerase, partial [Halobacteria archaeon]|nr:glucose-6-phosphate isomerase [Halobacteria archaeon]
LQLFVEGPNDKVVTFVSVDGSEDFEIPGGYEDEYDYLGGSTLGELRAAELDATQASLVESNCPNMRVELDSVNESEVGELLYTYEVAVAVAGELYGINPFNQPGVESGKRATYGLLGRDGYEDEVQRVDRIKKTLFEIPK